jgi:hypothetical protein
MIPTRFRLSLLSNALKRFLPVIFLLVSQRNSQADAPERAMEPDVGFFTSGPPDPYRLALWKALVASARPNCEFLVISSSEPEWSTYIESDSPERVEVVSRRLKESLHYEMSKKTEKGWDARPGLAAGPFGRARALRRTRPIVVEQRRSLEHALAGRIKEICRRILLRSQYGDRDTEGQYDGTLYYAIHWTGRTMLSGTTWSPPEGSTALAFTNLGRALRRYAESAGDDETALEALRMQTESLESRLGRRELETPH